MSGLLERVSEAQRPAAKAVIEELFPVAKSLLEESNYDGDHDWFPQLRICSHEVFDRYFQLATPEGDITQRELDDLIAASTDRTMLKTKFEDLKRRSLLEVALDRLDSLGDELPLDGAASFTTALFELDLKDDPESFFEFRLDSHTHINRIIYGLLRRELDQQRRLSLLRTALTATTALATPILFVWDLEDAAAKASSDPNPLLERQEDIHELSQIGTLKIKKAAAAGDLARNERLGLLLSFWRQFGVAEEVQEWTATLIKSRDGLFSFLSAVQSTARSHGSGFPKQTRYIKLIAVEQFVKVEDVETALRSYTTENLTEHERNQAVLFHKAFQRRIDGRPECGFMLDGD